MKKFLTVFLVAALASGCSMLGGGSTESLTEEELQAQIEEGESVDLDSAEFWKDLKTSMKLDPLYEEIRGKWIDPDSGMVAMFNEDLRYRIIAPSTEDPDSYGLVIPDGVWFPFDESQVLSLIPEDQESDDFRAYTFDRTSSKEEAENDPQKYYVDDKTLVLFGYTFGSEIL